jgi:general secretion pathway protein D
LFFLSRNSACIGACTAVLVAALTAGCATTAPELTQARNLSQQGQLEEAVKVLGAGMARQPQDAILRAEWLRLRDLWISSLLAQAEQAQQARRTDDAQALLGKVLALDPAHPRALAARASLERVGQMDQRVAQAEQRAANNDLGQAEADLRLVLAEDPSHAGARKALGKLRERQTTAVFQPSELKSALALPITLELRDTPLRNAFEVIARTAPLNFVFDRDVRADARITLTVRSSPVEDVIKLLLATQSLDRKLLNDNSMLIYPDTAAKQREYRDLVTRMFYLNNADAKQAQALLRAVGKIKEVHVDERLNMVAIRDSADAVRLAEKLVASIDLAEPEVMLEVEVLEISRSRVRDLGIRFPSQALVEQKLPGASNLPTNRINLDGLRPSQLAVTITNPAMRIGLQSDDTDVKVLANPRIRAKNREKAKVLIGEKLPVFTTTAVQNAGVAASVSYLDIGLKLEVEPTIFLDDEVAIKVLLEVSSELQTVTGPDGSTAFRLGNRSAQTSLRLRDGETQVLAGLIEDRDRETFSKLPGLGDLPGIGRAFGNTANRRDSTEIVLLITPRVLRNLSPPGLDSIVIPAGTEAVSGASPLKLSPTAARGLAMPPAAAGGRLAVPTQPAAAAPGGAAPAVAEAIAPRTALQTPGEISLGKDFTVQVNVSGVGDAAQGEAVLQFDASLLQAAGGSGSRVVVPLSQSAAGQLSGSVSFKAVAAGAGAASVRLVEGSVRTAEGRSVPLPASAASVRIGL